MSYKNLTGSYPSGYTLTATSTFTGLSISSLGSIGGSGLLVQKSSAVVLNSGSSIATSLFADGVQATAAGVVLTNYSGGTISGFGGVAFTNVSSGGTLHNKAGGHISGTSEAVDLLHGGYVSNAGYLTGTNGAFVAQGAAVTLVNTGSIGSTGTTASSVALSAGGLVTNGGSTITGAAITAVYNAFSLSGVVAATIVNYGTVQSTGTAGSGVTLGAGSGVSVTNSGTAALITGANAIRAFSAATIVNSGKILSTGSASAGVYLAAGGSVSNSGDIKGAIGFLDKSGSKSTVATSGTIESSAGASGTALKFTNTADRLIVSAAANFVGTVIGGNGTLELASPGPGTLSGLGGQFVSFSALAVDKGSAWTLAGSNKFSGIATNHGTFTLSGTLANTGSVVAASGYGDGLYLAAGASLTNGSSLDKYALISGAVGVDALGGATVTNYGSLDSVAGASGTAVSFGSAGDRLILEPTATFLGTVVGGGGTMELAAGTGILSGLGSAFTGFALYQVDAGGYWSLSGTNTIGATASVSNTGTLAVVGVLANHATISGDGVTVAATGSLANFGAIHGAAGATYPAGVSLTGSGAVHNYAGGAITGAFWGLYGSAGGSLVNGGYIYGVGGAEIRGAGAYITNVAGGTIKGSGDGLVTYKFASVINAGLIEGTSVGFEGAGTNFVSNSGTIEAVHNFAAFLAGDTDYQDVLINNGVVAGGVETFGDLFVHNYATITGNYAYTGKAYKAAGIYVSKFGYSFGKSTIINNGTIAGIYGVVLGDAATLTNFGTLKGTKDALKLGVSGDRLIVEGGSTIIGSVVGGGGTLEMAGAAGAGSLTGPGTSFSGFAGYVVDAGAAWTLTSGDSIGNAATVSDYGTLTNLGSIVSSVYRATPAVAMGAAARLTNGGSLTPSALISGISGVTAGAGASIGNYGTIQGLSGSSLTGGAYLTGGGTVTNFAGALIEGINGIYAAKGLSLTNAGEVLGGPNAAIWVRGATGYITNTASGLITATYLGILGTSVQTITNAGTIWGKAGAANPIDAGIDLAAGGMVTNSAGGVIKGAGDGIYLASGGSILNAGYIADTSIVGVAGVFTRNTTGAATYIGNAAGGTIKGLGEGIEDLSTGAVSIVNHGLISGPGDWGVGGQNGNLSLSNYGVVSGGIGVILRNPGSHPASTINNHGSIVGGLVFDGNVFVNNYGSITLNSSTFYKAAVYLSKEAKYYATGTLTNHGLISSQYAVQAGGPFTVNNFGTLSGTAASVKFSSAADRLIDEGGSVFYGVILGGGGTLELAAAGGAGAIAALGSYYSGFSAYAVDAGAAWTVNGGNTVAAGVTLTNKGSLTLNGDLTNLGGIIAPAGYHDGLDLKAGSVLVNGSSLVASAQISGHIGVGGVGTVVNYGTIASNTGAYGLAVGFSAAGGRVVAEKGSVFAGQVEGGFGTLELANATGTISALGGTFRNKVSGGITASFYFFNTYQLDAGGAWTLTGTSSLGSGMSLIDNAGSLTLAVGSSFAINNAASAQVQGVITNIGGISVVSGASLTNLRIAGAGATFAGGGKISLSGPKSRIFGTATTATLTNVNNTIVGSGWLGLSTMTLVNQAAGVIEALGNPGLVVNTKGAVSSNSGLLESATNSTLTLQNTTLLNTGGMIAALSGGVVSLQDDVIRGGTIEALGTGVVKFNVAGGELDGTTSAVSLSGVAFIVNGSNETLEGSIANAGKINLIASTSTCDLIIGAAGATLSGGGQVNMTNSLSNRIYGLASGDTLTNVDNRIDGAGALGSGTMTLINDAAGQIVGNQNLALTIDTGTNTIVNAGLIENVGKGGTLVKSAVANTGTLLAATAGTLTFAGTVTGSGSAIINGGTLYVQQAFAEKVTFTGSTGTLELGASQAFTGKVVGLSTSGTSALDLVDIGFFAAKTKATYSGSSTSGTLTVTDGTHTAHIALQGNYLSATWTLSGDGHGGTKVVDPSAGSLSQAMASFQAGPAPALAGTPAYLLPKVPLLHAHA